jgi:hypothetical protein
MKWLTDILQRRDLSKTDKLLAVLLDEAAPAKSNKEIRRICTDLQFPVSPSDVRSHLQQPLHQRKITYSEKRWCLTDFGRVYLGRKGLLPDSYSLVVNPEEAIRIHIGQIKNPARQQFLWEAVQCLEEKLYRSAIVMSWLGAMAILNDFVVKNELERFNIQGAFQDPLWQNVSSVDDLSRLKEVDFLQIIGMMGLIEEAVEKQLNECLRRRNRCGRPNAYQINRQVVAQHIEILVLNVYAKFET